jgi:hypothetical protein
VVKGYLGLRALGVNSKCSQIYIGQSDHLIDTRLKEHHEHIWLEHTDKSDMVEHISLGHHIQLHNIGILSTKPRYMDYIFREEAEIELRPNILNREDCLCLSKSWKLLICSLKDHWKPPSQDSIRFSTRSRTSVHTALNRTPTLASLGTHQP